MKYFILTMQYNENLMLPIFINHYSKFLDKKHIKIIDHGSTNIPETMLKNHETIYLPRDKGFSEWSRLRLVQHTVAGLLEYYDFGIYVDCDELIDLTDIDKIDFTQHKIHHTAGFDVFFRKTSTGIRLRGLLNPGFCKPAIFSYMPYWTPGFHECGEKLSMLSLPSAHIRFLYKDYAIQRSNERFKIYTNDITEVERNTGVNTHWLTPHEHLNSFYQYINEKDCSVSKPFETIDPSIFLGKEDQLYKFSNTEYDLTERYPQLLSTFYMLTLGVE